MVKPTIYEAIGGDAGIRAVVEQFYDRLLKDETLAPFFQTLSVERIERLKAHQVKFLTQALGGPEGYTGLSIADAHARFGIAQSHFNTVANHLIVVLRGLNVSDDLIAAVIEKVKPLAGELVKP